MSFCFTWPEFNKEFIETAKASLETALNRGNKPANICDRIQVKQLEMGKVPPELDILEIGELGEGRFRGMFRLSYLGDAHVMLETKVQANPLVYSPQPSQDYLPRAIIAADSPLVVPLEIRISDFRIRGIFVLIVSLTRGVTISFKNEPLEGVSVTSTFDNTPMIRKRLQGEIQQTLANLLREELPLLIHQLSLERIKGLAESIPPAFRSGPSTFSQRPSHPSAISSVFSPESTTNYHSHFEEGDMSNTNNAVYYFYRNGIIQKVNSAQSLCDPLLRHFATSLCTKAMREIFPTEASFLSDLADCAARKIPILGEQIRDALLEYLSPPRVEVPGLSSILTASRNSVDKNPFRKGPSSFIRSCAISDSLSEASSTFFDTDDFIPMDMTTRYSMSGSLLIARPSGVPARGAIEKGITRTSLQNRLSILKSINQTASPFRFPSRQQCTIVHRSQPHPLHRRPPLNELNNYVINYRHSIR